MEGRGVEPLANRQAVRLMLRCRGRAGEGALLVRQRDGHKLVRSAAAKESVQAEAVMSRQWDNRAVNQGPFALWPAIT